MWTKVFCFLVFIPKCDTSRPPTDRGKHFHLMFMSHSYQFGQLGVGLLWVFPSGNRSIGHNSKCIVNYSCNMHGRENRLPGNRSFPAHINKSKNFNLHCLCIHHTCLTVWIVTNHGELFIRTRDHCIGSSYKD
ncbi:hypothetical protein AB4K20DRAFT_1217116 [Rhizopus microsporus]